jgi:hypothetical protein
VLNENTFLITDEICSYMTFSFVSFYQGICSNALLNAVLTRHSRTFNEINMCININIYIQKLNTSG